MIRTCLRAGVFAAAVTGAVAVALAVGQARRSAAPANGAVSLPAPTGPGPTSRPRVAGPAASTASLPSTVDFYSASTKVTVAVPLDRVRKRRTVRVGDNGRRQERYAAIAELESDGRQLRLFKFISREQFERLEVPEQEA